MLTSSFHKDEQKTKYNRISLEYIECFSFTFIIKFKVRQTKKCEFFIKNFEQIPKAAY